MNIQIAINDQDSRKYIYLSKKLKNILGVGPDTKAINMKVVELSKDKRVVEIEEIKEDEE